MAGRDSILLQKCPVKGADGVESTTGAYVGKALVLLLHEMYCFIEPKCIHIIGETLTNPISKQMADMPFAQG